MPASDPGADRQGLMPPKLLIVDTDRAVGESLRKLLEARNYEVFSTRDGGEALEYFQAHPMDLVVLDINLDAANGWEIYEQMMLTNPGVPTIVMIAEAKQRTRARACGVETLVEKPIDVPAFLEMIHRLLAEPATARLKRPGQHGVYHHHLE